jgi:hypothetical protein
MYVLSENTKLFRTFDGPVEHIDRFSIRVRAYSETQTWFVEATNGWTFSSQGNVLAFVAVSNPDVRREITHTLADRLWKHVNEYVATIDANIVSLYVNGESVLPSESMEDSTFDFEPWSVLQLHGGTSPKTIFDVLQVEHNTVWTASNVVDMYAAVSESTDDRLIQFVNTPTGSVHRDMFGGNIEDTGRMSVRVKTDKDTSSWTLTASDSWVFRYESNVLTFEEPETQMQQVDLTEQVAQSVSNVSDYLVNVERRNVHFFFNGQKVGTETREPNTFSWSHANIESESGPIHLTEILVNEAWSSDYIANVFTA